MVQTISRVALAEEALQAFVAAWLAPNAAERRRQLSSCWSDDGTFLAPNAESRGQDALVQAMSSMTVSWPINARIGTSEISEHHGWFQYTWKVVGGNDQIHGQGLHLAELDDAGRLRRVVAFYGAAPEPERAS